MTGTSRFQELFILTLRIEYQFPCSLIYANVVTWFLFCYQIVTLSTYILRTKMYKLKCTYHFFMDVRTSIYLYNCFILNAILFLVGDNVMKYQEFWSQPNKCHCENQTRKVSRTQSKNYATGPSTLDVLLVICNSSTIALVVLL